MNNDILDYKITQTKDVNGVELPVDHRVRVRGIEGIVPHADNDKSVVVIRPCTFASGAQNQPCNNAPEIPEIVELTVLTADLIGNDNIADVIDNYFRGPYLEAAYTPSNIVRQ